MQVHFEMQSDFDFEDLSLDFKAPPSLSLSLDLAGNHSFMREEGGQGLGACEERGSA
ncbi:unnamed protein product [Camellia sinensis]